MSRNKADQCYLTTINISGESTATISSFNPAKKTAYSGPRGITPHPSLCCPPLTPLSLFVDSSTSEVFPNRTEPGHSSRSAGTTCSRTEIEPKRHEVRAYTSKAR